MCTCMRVCSVSQSCLTLCDSMDYSPPDFIFVGSKITVDGDCSHEIKRHLLLEPTQHIKKKRPHFADKDSVVCDSLRPHESQHAKPPCPSLTPGSPGRPGRTQFGERGPPRRGIQIGWGSGAGSSWRLPGGPTNSYVLSQ